MLKYIYRIIILIGVFVAALFYFSRDIKEVVFNIDNTTVMEDATFPLVTIKTGDDRVNLLHGYSSNLNANAIREAITPIGQDQSFDIIIDQQKYDIKKLNFELRDCVGNTLIESNSISVFEEKDGLKSAKIKLKTELISGKEYAVKITLITSESKKMYFYHRVKRYDSSNFHEDLAFIMNFHKALRKKDSALEMTKYLEPENDADNSSLAYVNINSNFDLVSWGDLHPKFLTDIVPTVKEIYADTASVELDYYISAEVAGKTEYYQVKEFYRVRYSSDRMYLLNYERRMEALFDTNLTSVAKSELKLGISSNLNVPFLASVDQKKLAFVRNQELWFYNLEDNEITRIFSFRQKKTDFIRDVYDQHDIRILDMDAEGNMDFMVYGYMNRGQYEGRVAVILYQFIRSENRIEELVYIPVEEPYQTLKENLGDLAYVNTKDVFYFHIYNNIYSFNLITRELKTVASDIHKNHVVVLKDLNCAAWQESSDISKSKNICIMNLETEEKRTIPAKPGYDIRLMDMIDSNLIYGYVKEDDIATMMDGRLMCPVNELEIATVDKNILKNYKKPGYYISDVNVKDNVVELSRVLKITNGGMISYAPATNDYIMNQVKGQSDLIGVTTRVTDQALTELYMTLPTGFAMTALPKVKHTVNTVIAQDPTVRLPEEEQKLEYYYSYVVGGIQGAYEEASEAIKVADAGIGEVLDNRQQLVWERGVRATKSTISKFESMEWNVTSGKTMESCIELLLRYQGINETMNNLSTTGSSAMQVLNKYSKYIPIRLSGITLQEAFYYISMGRPVIAMTDQKNAVLIYGFDEFNILVIDPKTGTAKKMGIQDSTKLFEQAGNVFLSYLE